MVASKRERGGIEPIRQLGAVIAYSMAPMPYYLHPPDDLATVRINECEDTLLRYGEAR